MLKGDSKDKVDNLDAFGSGIGRLGRTIRNEGDLVLGLTSDDLDDL